MSRMGLEDTNRTVQILKAAERGHYGVIAAIAYITIHSFPAATELTDERILDTISST